MPYKTLLEKPKLEKNDRKQFMEMLEIINQSFLCKYSFDSLAIEHTKKRLAVTYHKSSCSYVKFECK